MATGVGLTQISLLNINVRPLFIDVKNLPGKISL